MSRYYWSKKTESDDLKKIEIWWLKKYHYLDGWKSGSIEWTSSWADSKSTISIVATTSEEVPHLQIIYTQTDTENGSKKDFNYKIPLTTTPCYFGGKRYWFICPWYSNGQYCGKRVGVLYKGGNYFACRNCYDLTYNSRNLSGILKVVGQVMSASELDKLEAEVKRKYYAGKMTRKYKLFRKKGSKFTRQMTIVSRGLGIYP